MEALASRLAELEALAVPGNVRLFTCALPSTWATLAGLASEASARVADALRSAAVSGCVILFVISNKQPS